MQCGLFKKKSVQRLWYKTTVLVLGLSVGNYVIFDNLLNLSEPCSIYLCEEVITRVTVGLMSLQRLTRCKC